MTNPCVRYQEYHRNRTNQMIHVVCVPLILATAQTFVSVPIASFIDALYSANFLLFDLFSKKSFGAFSYLQVIFVAHFLLRKFCSTRVNVSIHIFSWVLQFIGHAFFEGNSPALLDNLYDSLLFAPYFTYLETFHSNSMRISSSSPRYKIISNDYDKSKRSLIYFAGLFQRSDEQFGNIAKSLPQFNHIFVNVHFQGRDDFKSVLSTVRNELSHIDLECIVGYSFGGSLSLIYKHLHEDAENIKTILISPGGFRSNNLFERGVQITSRFFYRLYGTKRWFMVRQYPVYQNKWPLSDNDYLIHSSADQIHSFDTDLHKQSLSFKSASHYDIVDKVTSQKVVGSLIQNDYDCSKIKLKDSSTFEKLVFGGHFKIHTVWWILTSGYYLMKCKNTKLNLLGALIASTSWSIAEYMFHRFLLHDFFYKHHSLHHKYPNKLSIIHTPMFLVVANWFVFFVPMSYILPHDVLVGFCTGFPLCYLSFEMTHSISHSNNIKNKIMLNAKYYHKLHHIEKETNFSFVTPFWDFLFGTLSDKFPCSSLELLLGFIPFYSFLVSTQTHRE